METIKNIIAYSAHRPWPLPTARWAYYQEWNKALFLHWKVPAYELRPHVPVSLTIDEADGSAWVSLVAFTMEQIRPNGIPAFAPVSNFHEINVRTYVTAENKPGVYFLNIEAAKPISAFIARQLSGLPYEKAKMERIFQQRAQVYNSYNQPKGFALTSMFEPGAALHAKTPLDLWLTERYCLYHENNRQLFRYQIHHHPWPLQEVTIIQLQSDYRIGHISLNHPPDLAHYSPGVPVIAWKKEPIKYH